ncbi:OB-fold nucleic acid binding domain-containing protein [Colletotrichum gloeosporioides Cg-14]|uniref:OB-fold nucleic acid binding domain-containing protein n=1 Tax=Colletotrichum gloeosporioides (strain Cg-14) TaxID=1237896 RepID=T0LML2_COLGC|nr:OB-fold nucleic acid binding domain-containing protein [Colletotrichum gloeosporioides Cg-14]
MQIKIDKVKVLRSTEQEIALWERRTHFRNQVLLEPWVLTDKQIRRCKREQEDGDDDERRRRKKEKRREEKKRAAEEEEKRRKAAAEAEVANRYRYHKMRKSQKAQERGAGPSSTLLRHVLDENMRGKYNALGL